MSSVPPTGPADDEPAGSRAADADFSAPRALVSAPVTYLIVAVNVVVFALMVGRHISAFSPTVDQLRAWGACYGPITVTTADPAHRAEPWRLVTMMFVHGGALHLALNMFALVSLGRTVERLVGSVVTAWVYLACGIFGSLTSIYAKPLDTSVGASGAILGIASFMLMLVMRRRVRLPPAQLSQLASGALVFLAMTFALGFSSPGIDNAAHFGGTLAGFMLGALVPPLDNRSRSIVIGRLSAIVVPVAALGVIDARHVGNVPAVRAERLYHAAYAQAYALQLDDAVATMTEAIATLPEVSAPYVARGQWNEARGKLADAQHDYDVVIERDPAHPIARERRCVLLASRRELELARQDCDVAVRGASDSSAPFIARANVSLLEQKWPQAIDDLSSAIRVDPKLALAYRARAAAELAAGDKASSLRDIEHAATLEPARADVYVTWVHLLVDAGEAARAVIVATQAIAAFPREPQLLLARASAHAVQSDFTAARDDAKAAAVLAPTFAIGRNAYAWYLRLAGDSRAAVTEASEAMQLAPESGAIADTRCWARFEAGDREGAVADCLHAIELDGTLKPTLGLLAYMRGDFEVAVRAWEEAAKESPTEANELAPWIARAVIARDAKPTRDSEQIPNMPHAKKPNAPH